MSTDVSTSGGNKQPKVQPVARAENQTKKSSRRQEYVRRAQQQLAQYQVFATEVELPMRIGNAELARTVKKQWGGIHHGLHYLTDFARRNLKGQVVYSVNRGISEYLGAKMEETIESLKNANEMAENNGIRLGVHGTMNEFNITVSTEKERDVMDLIKLMDDYVIVVDSLWIGRMIEQRKRDEVHSEISDVINTLHRLLTKMRQKMIDFRHRKQTKTLSKDEQGYAKDIEYVVLDVTGIDLKKIRDAEARAAAVAKKASDDAKQAKAAQQAQKSKKKEIAQSANDSVLPEQEEADRLVAAA